MEEGLVMATPTLHMGTPTLHMGTVMEVLKVAVITMAILTIQRILI